MRPRLKRSVIAAVTAALSAALWMASTRIVGGQSASAFRAPRTADDHPNLSGIWQALNTANWDIEDHSARAAPFEHLVGAYLAQPPGLSVVDGGTIPYKPEALARRNQNFEKRLKSEPVNLYHEEPSADPEAKCFAAPPPRAAYMPFPFQIAQNKDVVVMAYEYASTPRLIHLGKVDEQIFYGLETWTGQSRGRWDGDALVVETQGFAGQPWLDRAGNFMSRQARVTERYTPTSPYHLMYEATIDDPEIFTRSWKLSMPLYRRLEPNAEILEFHCIPFIEEFLYGTLKKEPRSP